MGTAVSGSSACINWSNAICAVASCIATLSGKKSPKSSPLFSDISDTSLAWPYKTLSAKVSELAFLDLNSAIFDSPLNPFVYLWIVISNSIVVLLTFGLMSPWAQIRFYRYFCRSTKMEVTGNLDLFGDSEKT